MIRLFDTPAAAQGNWSRRDLLRAGVLGVGGLALSNMLQLESVRRAVAARVQRPARNCIFTVSYTHLTLPTILLV